MQRREQFLLESALFLSDGGLESSLIHHEGLDLPYLAAFDLLRDEAGTDYLRSRYRRHAELARAFGIGLVLESATWRASRDWGRKLGYHRSQLAEANRKAVALLHAIRADEASPRGRILVSGKLGPRNDGGTVEPAETAAQSRAYHAEQIGVLAAAGVDLVTASAIGDPQAACGIVLAARDAGVPVLLSFALDADGRLAGGATLRDAIERTDDASAAYAAGYIIDCLPPTQVERIVEPGAAWLHRILGWRAHASPCSPRRRAAPGAATGDPRAFADDFVRLRPLLPELALIGACCDTDHRHLTALCAALVPTWRSDRMRKLA